MNLRSKIITVFVSFFLMGLFTVTALAHQNYEETGCNANNPTNCPSSEPICGNGEHVGNPHCVSPSPSSSPTASPSVEPSSSPSGSPKGCSEDCDEGTPTPSATASATPTDAPHSDSFSNPGVEQTTCVKPPYAPILTFVSRDGGDVTFSWTPVEQIHTYLVEYCMGKSSLTWNELVTGESTTLHFLPKGSVWAHVAADSDGCVGDFSLTIDP